MFDNVVKVGTAGMTVRRILSSYYLSASSLRYIPSFDNFPGLNSAADATLLNGT